MHSIIWKRLRPMRWREKRFLNFPREQSSSIRPAGKFAYIKSKRWGIFEKYWPSLWTPYCIIHQIAGFGGREVAMFFIAEHVGVRKRSWVRYKPFCYDVIVRRPTCRPALHPLLRAGNQRYRKTSKNHQTARSLKPYSHQSLKMFKICLNTV